MAYFILLACMLLSAGGGAAAMVVGIVLLCRRKRRGALYAFLAFFFCVLLGLGSGGALVIRAGSDLGRQWRGRVALAEATQKARADAIKALTPGVDWSRVDEQYWTYDGYRDWWRVPIRYPYEMQSIDTLDWAELRRNRANGRSDDPNSQSEQFNLPDIGAYAYDGHMLVYQAVDENRKVTGYGYFVFDTERREGFATEKEMWDAARKAEWVGSETLKSAEAQYNAYWR